MTPQVVHTAAILGCKVGGRVNWAMRQIRANAVVGAGFCGMSTGSSIELLDESGADMRFRNRVFFGVALPLSEGAGLWHDPGVPGVDEPANDGELE